MTMRWIEGFEARLHENLQAETYGQDGTGGYGGVTTAGAGTAGRKIGKSLRVSDGATFTTPVLVPAASNTWIIQFAIRKGAGTNMAGGGFVKCVLNGSGTQLEIRQVNGAREGTWALEVFRGVTSLGQTQDYAYGGQRTWMCFQAEVVINTGTSGSVNIKAWDYFNNSTTALNLTSQNTADQGVAAMDQVIFALNDQLDSVEQWDDIVIMDNAGSVNNAQTAVPFLIFGALPNGDGPTVDWDPSTGSTHWNLLASVATVSGNGEEVTSDTVTELEQFPFADIPEMSDGGTPAIAGMMVDIHGAMKNSGTRTLRVNVDDPVGGNADVATDLIFSNLVLTARTLIMETNPVSAVAWTLADLEDHYIGFKLHA